MANNSKIQWTDHTVNFWTGCTKVSDGCKFCYMYRDKERYGQDPQNVLKVSQSTINKVLKAAKPGDKMFVCSWSDFFISDADSLRDWAWDVIRSRPDLIWQILTKRPERVLEHLPKDWGSGWDNVWIGVSVENQKNANDRIKILCEIPAKTRFLSAEPLIGEIDFMKCSDSWSDEGHPWRNAPLLFGIDWVIVGGESGNENGKYTYRPCARLWIDFIVHQCHNLKVPCFVKQTGTSLSKKLGLKDRHGGNFDEFPESFKVRQFPGWL